MVEDPGLGTEVEAVEREDEVAPTAGTVTMEAKGERITQVAGVGG